MTAASEPKKTNWIMVILLVILIPILLLGYKFFSKKMDEPNNTVQTNLTQDNGNNTSSAQNADFPTGTWYRNDPSINSKYIFDAPQLVNGKSQGQMNVVMDDRSEGKVNYEIISDGKLRISDPQGSFPAWELGYAYNTAGQSLEIIASGHSATYTRNPVYIPANNPTPTTLAPTPPPSNNNAVVNNKNINTSQLPPVGFDQPKKPADFSGLWTDEGNIGASSILTIELKQSGSQVDGTLECENFDGVGNLTYKSGLWSIGGNISGNIANITIYDGKGRKVSTGTLSKSGNTVNFSISKSNPFVPQKAKLFGR